MLILSKATFRSRFNYKTAKLKFTTKYKSLSNRILDVSVFLFSTILFSTSINWLFKVFFGLYDFFNLFLLILILALIGNKIKWKINLKSKAHNYSFKILPFIIVILSIALWLYSTIILDINIISAFAGFLYVFGLLGLYTNTKFWISSIIPFSLIVMTLPFGNIMDVYIGFPLRLMAVDSIAAMLNSLGLENISSSTIITIENSATQIDFSCSGIKGLWSGLIFYFSITWLDKLKINLNWLITFALLIITILSANILRIFIIVLLGSVYNLSELAEIVHAPLGIIGFVFSCLLIYYFIKSKLFKKEFIQFNISSMLLNKLDSFKMKKYKNLYWSRYLIILILVISIFIPKEKSIEINKAANINFPSEWVTNPLDLTEEEVAFFENQGSLATKIAFETHNISGSLLLVNSNGWRGHHNPEYCMRAGGNTINKIETMIITDGFPIKWLNVNKESSACYWFQSPTECTDDFGTRVWSELRTKENDWILISVVFNNFQSIDTKEINDFILTINRLIKEQKEHKNTL